MTSYGCAWTGFESLQRRRDTHSRELQWQRMSVGAEIVSTQYEMALQPFVACVLFIVYVVCIAAIAIYIRGTIKDFISSTFVKVRSTIVGNS